MNRTRRRVGLDVKHEGREPRVSAGDMLACARLAEQLGFDSFWTNEDIGYDSMAVLSSIAPQTRSIGLGTAIVNVYNRSALQIAMGIATLDEVSGGRATLGLSVGHHPWNDLGHGIPLEAPLARLREYVAFIRKALSGHPFKHDGRFFQGVDTRLAFDPVREAVPIYVGGERPGMVKLAGQVADGLILNVVTADYIASFAADHFRSSARAAGRDADALELMAIVTICAGADRAEALSHARATFMNRLAANPTKMVATQPEHHDQLRYLADMITHGHRDQAQQEASEALVTSLIATGTPSEVWASIDRYFAAGCTRVVIAPFPRGRAPAEGVLCALAAGL